MIVAVDGPAASGKGTLAKRLATHYRLAHLDTGALYRAVARDVLASGGDPQDADAAARLAARLDPMSLDDPRLRAMGETASLVAKHPQVRAALIDYQRQFAANRGGAVLDGRDIGTVVCPGADIKLFVTASVEERARRRFRELAEAGEPAQLAAVLEDLKRRDARDSERAYSPMKPATDAHLLDTTNLDIETAFKTAVELIEALLGPAGRAT